MNIRRWGPVILLLIVWGTATSLGLFSPLLLPSPKSVLQLALSSSQWKAVGHDLGASCLRLVIGFALGSGTGLAIGVGMGRSRKVYEAFEFLVDFFRSIPVAALFPLFIIFFGIGDSSKIATTAWSTALIVIVNTMYGVRSCSRTREEFAKTLGANRIQILKTVVFPEALPSILAGLRTGLSIALIVVIMTEMFLGTPSGLGQRIFNAALLYNTADLYFAIGLTGLIGYALNQGFVQFESHLLRWRT